MATSSPETKSIAPFNQPSVRHSKDDALSSLAFEKLYQASHELDPLQDLETQLALLACGRLGLRRGELTHMQADWIDWRQRRIVIPERETCLKGRDGGMCAHCRQMAHQKTDVAIDGTAEALSEIHRAVDRTDARLEEYGPELRTIQKAMDVPHDELLAVTDGLYAEGRIHRVLTEEYRDAHLTDSLASRWEPKTENAARQIPFSFSPRAEMALERYFIDEAFPEWMYTAQAINRRLKWVAEKADVGHVSPHSLRATAATHQAARMADAFALQAMFGWSSISTAKAYIASNADNLDQKLRLANQ